MCYVYIYFFFFRMTLRETRYPMNMRAPCVSKTMKRKQVSKSIYELSGIGSITTCGDSKREGKSF